MDLLESIYTTRQLLTALQHEQWMSILFSVQWWALLFLLISVWIAWWKLVDKKMGFQVLSYALLVAIFGTALDTYGYKLGLWSYPIKLFYLNPGLISGDWALPPVVKSLIYQHYPDWKRFIVAQVALAGFLAFIGEPILIWMGAYKMYDWSYWQSFLVYIPVAIVSKWIVDGLKQKFDQGTI